MEEEEGREGRDGGRKRKERGGGGHIEHRVPQRLEYSVFDPLQKKLAGSWVNTTLMNIPNG